MAKLIDLRPVWLPRGTLSNMTQTIMILFSDGQDCLCSLVYVYGCNPLMVSWISRMSSFMVISLRKFICCNHLVLLLTGSLVWYASCDVPYTV